jgi:hypothetical protein
MPASRMTSTELTLQRLDLSPQPQLSEMQRLGGPTEMQVLGERHGRSELGQAKLPVISTVIHAGSSTPVNDEQLSSSS